MNYIGIIKMDLKFPFIYAEFKNGEKYCYDINEMVPEREEYEQLLNEEYFYKAKLGVKGWDIHWDDFADIPCEGIIKFGEKIG